MANPLYVTFFLALVSSCVLGAEPQAEDVIFRKEIAPGTLILVTRLPFDGTLLESIDPSLIKDRGRPFTISVELQRGGKQALLGSSVLVEFDDFRSGFQVLDIACADNDIVIACSVYDMVGLWRIPSTIGLVPKPGGWALVVPSRFAARAPLKPGFRTSGASNPTCCVFQPGFLTHPQF